MEIIFTAIITFVITSLYYKWQITCINYKYHGERIDKEDLQKNFNNMKVLWRDGKRKLKHLFNNK